MKRDYRLPIAKRFGPTAARTFDTNATEIVTIGVSTFPHFSQSTLSTARRLRRTLYFRHRDTLLRVTGHCKLGSDTLDVFSNFYISDICVGERILNANFLVGVDVQLEVRNSIIRLLIKNGLYYRGYIFLEFY